MMANAAAGTDILRDKNVFFGLSDEQLEMIAGLCRRAAFGPGEPLFREGDPGDALYIVESGNVELFRTREDGTRVTLATVAAGALLGEMSLVNIEPRSATGVAVGETRVIALRNNHLAELLREDKDLLITLLLNITRILSKRLRQADQKLI